MPEPLLPARPWAGSALLRTRGDGADQSCQSRVIERSHRHRLIRCQYPQMIVVASFASALSIDYANDRIHPRELSLIVSVRGLSERVLGCAGSADVIDCLLDDRLGTRFVIEG